MADLKEYKEAKFAAGFVSVGIWKRGRAGDYMLIRFKRYFAWNPSRIIPLPPPRQRRQ